MAEGKIKSGKIPGGVYTLKLFIDENDNGVWNTGSLDGRLFPEKVIYYSEGLNVRSNWETEFELSIFE